jgi:hypothetical protein
VSKYTDPDQNFKLDLAKVSKTDDEQFRQMLLIFHICYNLTGAPDGSLEWLEKLYLTGEFTREGPVKLYDKWLVKGSAPTDDYIPILIKRYQYQRQTLLKWQDSENGLLLVDAKLVCDQSTLEWFYLYEFPFIRLVERVWNICPLGLSTPRIKVIAKREFHKMYPDHIGSLPKAKRKQTSEEKLKRIASALLSLLNDYNNQHGERIGPTRLEIDLNEILEERVKPLIIKVSDS